MIKFTKICNFLLMSFVLLFVISCAESEFEGTTYPTSAYNSVDAALIQVSDVVTGFYDKGDPSSSSIGFTVDQAGGADVSSMDIQFNYNGVELYTLTNVTSLPTTVTVPFTDVLSAAGVGADQVVVGDLVTFEFNNIVTSGGTYGTSTTLNIPVSCASDLGGTYPYVSSNLKAENGYGCPDGEITGEVTFEAQGGGVYLCSDLGFGQYGTSCWGDAPATSGAATFTDVCNGITSGGLDQYGLVYIWVITDVSGPDLSISWSNDYGDGGDVVITRPDGTDWPPIFSE